MIEGVAVLIQAPENPSDHATSIVGTIFASLLVAISGTASLRAQGPILHYTFDSVFDTNKTADSVGSGNFATLGNQVNINTTTGSAFAGSAGVLEMTNVDQGRPRRATVR